MAFGFFNDTKSHLMTIPYYGYPGSLSFQYPSAIPVHYPKVFIQKNSTINYKV